MRWDNLRAGVPGPPALFAQGAVRRTFDTPAFRGMTFYEIQARSILNRVPEASRVPFRWTINTFRGCTHACVYCLAGDTPVLMSDGRAKPISDLTVGDRVVGTERVGNYRRYVTTEVAAHWQTVKPAYRITLADGTTLIASGDHRFLTERGWKHVTGTGAGAARRPHLAAGNTLLGVGRLAESPKHDEDYRLGYLAGIIRGDGSLDREAHARTVEFLHDTDGVAADSVLPSNPGPQWQRGFLAGIFDAEGSYSRGILRIANCDADVLAVTRRALDDLAFRHSPDGPRGPSRVYNVRLLGGLREHLRFFLSVDPAITRKRVLQGAALTGGVNLGVVTVAPLGVEVPMYDITTGTGDFIANGVVSHNCFARNTHTYLDLDAGRDFETQIVVKVNAVDLLRKELAAPRWSGEHIAMGTNTDPYQRAEGRYSLMPGIIRTLADAANPFSILTKGTLIERDIPLLTEAADVTDVSANVSVGFVGDDALWRMLEPGTPAPERRLAACRALNRAGVPCGVLMAPIVPFLTDTDEALDRTIAAIAAAGAISVSPIALHLRPGAREWFFGWLGEHHPELVPRYRTLYGRGAYLPQAFQRDLASRVATIAARHGIGSRPAVRSRGAHLVDTRSATPVDATLPLFAVRNSGPVIAWETG